MSIPLTGDRLASAVAHNKRQPLTRPAWVRIQTAVGTPADGLPGPLTAQAVAGWQLSSGLTADGMV